MTSVATPEVPSAPALSTAPLPAEADHISLADIARAHDVRFILATFVDMTGKPCAKLVPVGPPNRYEEVASHDNVTLMACKPCVEARGLDAAAFDRRIKLAGMNEFHAAAKQPDARVVNF